jgi:hypothetical protein
VIEVSPYQESHFDLLLMLHETQSSPTVNDLTPETLPKIGYVAMEGAVPVAMGFLRMIEGGFAQIDTLVSNGDLPSEMRHEGLTKLVDRIIETAKEKQLLGLMCLTRDEGILNRAESLGFHRLFMIPIGLNLTEVLS